MERYSKYSFAYLAYLANQAKSSKRLRKHKNIHLVYEDPCQRLINAIDINSYIQPHRHSLDPKAETLVALQGLFSLLIFNEAGMVIENTIFGTELYHSLDINIFVEISAYTWHTVIALKPCSVLLEIKSGPFNPCASKELASWAPLEQAEEAGIYFEELKRIASNEDLSASSDIK